MIGFSNSIRSLIEGLTNSDMDQESVKIKHNEIKQSYRRFMNGVTAQSLRDKGLDYHLNWGASLMHLREMAQEYPQDYDLASALWKDDIRESKILATMLMPVEEFPADLAFLWIEQTRSQEIAEIACKDLYSKTFYAKDLALQLIAQDLPLAQLHGYCILSSKFLRSSGRSGEQDRSQDSSFELTDSEINEFLDQAVSILQGNDLSLKHSALNAVTRFADINEMTLQIAKGALKFAQLDYFL